MCLAGEGLVGLLSGYSLGEKARRVRRGDVVAVPKGIAHWWYNTGNQELRILALSDTSQGVLGERDYTVLTHLPESIDEFTQDDLENCHHENS